ATALVPAALAVQDPPAPPPAPPADGPWIADFDQAVAVAKQQGKDLFVDFTGSDWCGWCKRLDAEVFSHAAFLDAAQEDYVLVKLDFPHDEAVKALVPNPERNAELRDQYGVRGYPTVLLLTAEGDVFAQTGYREGGPELYVEHLEKEASIGKPGLAAVKALLAEFEGAAGDAKLAVWDRVVAKLGELGDSVVANPLVPAVKAAFQLDPANEKGLKLRAAKALVDTGRLDAEVAGVARELDPQNEQGLLEAVVLADIRTVRNDDTARAWIASLEEFDRLGRIHDKEAVFSAMARAAMWANEPLGETQRAVALAQRALEIGAESENVDLIAELKTLVSTAGEEIVGEG
ncbi:MAG TPA: thioredoxin family protein, partial [Planctomycetota bacterium]|nr:thioredoxin family protein [Planctomycetota bacterium]